MAVPNTGNSEVQAFTATNLAGSSHSSGTLQPAAALPEALSTLNSAGGHCRPRGRLFTGRYRGLPGLRRSSIRGRGRGSMGGVQRSGGILPQGSAGHAGHGGTTPEGEDFADSETGANRPRDLQDLYTVLVNGMDHLKARHVKLDQRQNRFEKALGEMKEMLAKQIKTSFSLKTADLEAPIRKALAKLFCLTLTRYPDTEAVADAISGAVSGDDLAEAHVAETARKYANDMISSFRAEERRRVLGRPPQENAARLITTDLAANLMEYYESSRAPADREVKEEYTKHLALLRFFVRQHSNPSDIMHFHKKFQKWLAQHYTLGVSQEDWQTILEYDIAHPYSTHPLTEVEEEDDPGQYINENPLLSSASHTSDQSGLENAFPPLADGPMYSLNSLN